MHEIIFARSIKPQRVKVLNLLMQPYSIGHELLLQNRLNPLVTYLPESFKELPEQEKRLSVFMAAFICERSWAQNARPVRWLSLAMYCRRKLSTAGEVMKFQQYRADGSLDFPTVSMPRVQGAPYHYFGAPELARLLMFVNSHGLYRTLGLETAFDMPLGLARQLYLAQAEASGDIWVQNFQDAEREVERAAADAAGRGGKLQIGDEAVNAAIEKINQEHPELNIPAMD